ncbi:unnamed protein product [Spirodela intermedia]|uniref:phosphoenolpyruvate carboxykinase (ATP) n=1 Tax=Spirodela intermedia TaxID=51605 RepID=A0A7I8L981_SPIIN|nr:unnamed protein product [Spirodela intermedia]
MGWEVLFWHCSPGVSYGLNWSLAGRGVIVKDKAFYNLKSSDLQKHGAKTVDRLSGLPIHVRGDAVSGPSEISKAQFGKLLKQVTTHISSVSNIFVQDGAIGSSSKCDAKVRMISDCPSAALSLANVVWNTPARAVSHDSSPLTVYIATSISPKTGEILGLGSQSSNGFVAADIERSSLILCGKAFADADGVKDALAALSAPVWIASCSLPSSSFFFDVWLSMKLVTMLQNPTPGVVLSSEGVAPLFQTGLSDGASLLKNPSSLVFASADSSGVLPSAAKLSPGQAAYHFLAGYQDGKFAPAYSPGPSPISPLDLAKALLSHVKDGEVPSFLINVYEGGKHIAGKDLVKAVESTLSGSTPESLLGSSSDPKVGDLKGKYSGFLSGKFPEIPEEFTF